MYHLCSSSAARVIYVDFSSLLLFSRRSKATSISNLVFSLSIK
ncbi:unnamed protein product [Amoebophrya sp. A25]|nr:unnamed protein product [Amoebophrya sp. A25]|eukprot:GSA25T00025582001.1